MQRRFLVLYCSKTRGGVAGNEEPETLIHAAAPLLRTWFVSLFCCILSARACETNTRHGVWLLCVCSIVSVSLRASLRCAPSAYIPRTSSKNGYLFPLIGSNPAARRLSVWRGGDMFSEIQRLPLAFCL